MTKNPYEFPDHTTIPLRLDDLDILLEMQTAIYTPPLREERSCLETLLRNSELNFGIIADGRLAGFLMTTFEFAESDKDIFIWDIGILPEFQKRGLGTRLFHHFLNQAGQKGMNVSLACRNTSLPMFTKKDLIEEKGYRIVSCELEVDGYYKWCGVHEDMHHIEMEPIRS